MLFDSHAHYNDPRFEAEYPGGAAQALDDARAAGVMRILNAGTSVSASEASLALCACFPGMVASVGLHPTDSLEVPDTDLMATLDALRRLSSSSKAVAIGEIGLDYHWDPNGRERQKRIFDLQLSLAEEVRLPVIVHDREAHGDTWELVRLHPNVTGVFHSFSGSAEMARQLAAAGWYISFSGPITYKNARHLREAAAAVPPERILAETDAPYLPPVPHRGEINSSALLPCTVRAVADACGTSYEEMAARTYKNACTLFALQE